jgi:hypothetical protein
MMRIGKHMSELLALAIESHGGTKRWNELKAIDGHMSITGQLWTRKGWPDALKEVHVTVDTKSQLTRYQPFTAPNKRSVCRPDKTLIETLDGQVLEERNNPRSAFENHRPETKWDALNLAYFSGYAMWNYLCSPFIFALPGVATEEIEPCEEDGVRHRRLKVTFPRSIATHCPEQIFHIDPSGLLSRMDYSAEVVGGVPTAHFMSDYKDFGGVKIATKRRAFRRGADGTAVRDAVGVAIDIADIRLS